MYHKLGLALAFSPTFSALLAEAVRLKKLFNAELILIHVGVKNEEKMARFDTMLKQAGLKKDDVTIIWKVGRPADTIIKICKKERIDLLIAGALRHENLINYYVGSIARKIIRKAPCSVLIFTEPSVKAVNISEIVIDIESTPLMMEVIHAGLQQAILRKAKTIHFTRELKLYGLSMSVLSEFSQEEMSIHRKNLIFTEIQKIEKILESLDVKGINTHIKILNGKSGFELRKYTRKINADLLVVGSMRYRLRFLDRLFMNNLEFIIEDIPCNLLIVKPTD